MQPPRGHAGSPSVLPWAEPALAAEDCEGVAGGRPQLLETVARSVAKGQFHGVGIVTSQRRTCAHAAPPPGVPGARWRAAAKGGAGRGTSSLRQSVALGSCQSSTERPPVRSQAASTWQAVSLRVPPSSLLPTSTFFFFLNFKVPICFLFGGRVLQHEPKR